MNQVLKNLPFQIEKPLTGGQFTDVYLARDGETPVVIKVARKEPKDVMGATNGVFFAQGQWMVTGGSVDWTPDANEILKREAAVLEKIKHPAMVSLLQQGEAEGQVYLVLEYIAGQSWRAALSQDQVTLVHYFNLARTLSEVNQELGYHGDIKPDNLILLPSGETRIIDPSSHMTRLGANGEPEQIFTSQGYNPLLETSDVPAMGQLLFELLCDQPAFLMPSQKEVRKTGPKLSGAIETAKIIGQYDRYERLLNMPLPREVKSTIPQELQNIVLRCLGLNLQAGTLELCPPYKDMGSVARAIEGFLGSPKAAVGEQETNIDR